MRVFPATNHEQINGYSAEKLNYLKPCVIYDVEKLVIGNNYALATNGYHLGVYEGTQFVSHNEPGTTCGCHGFVYQFVRTESNGKQTTDSRSSEFISQVGVFTITY
jgi:hypothetical protein